MGLAIREASEVDAAMLSDLIRVAFADVAARFGLTPENCPRHPSNCTPEWVSSAMIKGTRYFVAEADGEAAGCVALEQAGPDVCYLERLAVLPTRRRCGLGAALVERIFRGATGLGASRVEIGVIARHTELTRWYEKQGFRPTRTATFEHLPFEVLFMSAELRAPGK